MSQTPGPGGPPTMRDVAAAAGVSKALVSIVFRGVPGASEETRAHVLAVADQIGYRANRTASLLARRRTMHLGVTFDLRNAFHGELVEAVQDAADERGYDVVLSTITERHNERRALNVLREFRCEALLLLGPESPRSELAELAAHTPTVLIGRREPGIGADQVSSADDLGMETVVDQLVSLGHRRIGHLAGPGPIGADRRVGFQRAMQRHGLDGDRDCVTGGAGEDGGRRGATEWLARGDLPTAITAYNDHCALGVVDVLRRNGIDVPGSVSVTGYDDSAVARLQMVDLTSVSQEAAEQAQWAVAAAVERLDAGRTQAREHVLTPRLVVRSSTGRSVVPSSGSAEGPPMRA